MTTYITRTGEAVDLSISDMQAISQMYNLKLLADYIRDNFDLTEDNVQRCAALAQEYKNNAELGESEREAIERALISVEDYNYEEREINNEE